jgi:virulence factor Mce-like protein
MTRLRSRLSTPVWGLVGLVLLALATYLVFGGRAGLEPQTFELRAMFRSDAQLGIRSPVRIAGVDVGAVTAVTPVGHGSDAAVVTMRIDSNGLPIHADATAKIRSRLLLEGNFFIELRPGSPGAPALRSGQTIGLDRTAGPVQLDRVLSDLTTNTRANLRTAVQGFGQAIGQADQGGESGGRALNDALRDLPQALRGTALSTSALLGIQPDDLANAIRGERRVLSAFADRENELAELIAGFDTTMGAFASQQNALRTSIEVLPSALGHARASLRSIDASLPATRSFAAQLEPSIRELPATIAAALPWVAQATALLAPDELGAVAASARPAVADAAGALQATQPLLDQLDALDRCVVHNLLPVSHVKVQDPPLTTNSEVYQEFLQTFVGVASAAQNFDGNGVYVRAQPGGGDNAVVTSVLPGQGPLRGNATSAPLGTRPAYPDKEPPFRTDVPCSANAVPDVNGAKTGAGP